ncbi:MAG TPA: LysE family translocator [Flavobacterium sp.]|nr:LysE family translocator [Flavobacterium sp.]
MISETVMAFFFASLALTIAPGPDVMYVLSTSIAKGKQYGIAAAVGLSSGLLFHTTLLAFGISAIIIKSPTLFKGIKIFGALYLLWLAYNVYRSDTSFQLKPAQSQVSKPWKNIFQGLIMNILNPKVMLFFLALFPTFIHTAAGNVKTQVYTLGIISFFQAFVVFCLYAILASSLTKILRENNTFNLLLKWLQIIVFASLAIFMMI